MDKDTAKDTLTLAAVQMTSTSVLEENLEMARAFIDQASAGGADIIALPENFSLMSASGMVGSWKIQQDMIDPLRRVRVHISTS